jgi:hypothetical protein
MVSRDTRRLVAFLPVHEKRGYRRLSLGLPHFYVAHPRRLSLVARFVLHSLTRLSHLERVFGVGAGEFLLLSMPASLKQAR